MSEKFIEYVKDGAYALACMRLDRIANSFGFSRAVPKIVEQLYEQCPENAEYFCMAFVIAVAKRYADGRCVKSVETAKLLLTAGWEQNAAGVKEALAQIELRVTGGSMHPTVMQQAAQVAFCYLNECGLVNPIKNNPELELRDWWRMPLI